eukprot:m.138429 g.138429  ORF g.138429 m.138429 type:complete len:320 (-) comp29994_c1_seq1:42-1001(-)
MATARQTPLTCSGHTRPVVDLTFSPVTPDGFFLISACKDGKPILRNGMTGDWLGTFEGHKGAVWGATINSSATLCATGAADFCAKTWNAISGDEMYSYQHPHIVKTVEFSADSSQLLTGCNDKVVRCWDVNNNTSAVVEMTGHKGNLQKVLWGTDGKSVLSGGDDKVIRMWDVRSGSETRTIPLDANLTGMEISQDGSILTSTHGSKVCFYNTTTMELIKEKKMESPVHSASLHPDGKTFVWGGMDNMLHVVDYESCEQLEEYKGHFGPVHCVRYSPDGEVYASGSEDGTVRLWQTRVGIEYGLWKFTKPEDKEADGAQ